MGLYAYGFAAGTIVSILSPGVGALVNKLKEFDGHFANCHSRIRHYKEEIAMLNGADTEREICDEPLEAVTEFAMAYRHIQFHFSFGAAFVMKYVSNKLGAIVLGWPALCNVA